MSLEKHIQEIIESKASYVSSFKYDDISESILLEIPLDKIREVSSKNFTSKRQIKNLSKKLELLTKRKVIISYRQSEKTNNLEIGLKEIISIKSGNVISNLSISMIDDSNCIVWIFTSESLSEEKKHEIKNQAENFLHSALIIVNETYFTPPKKEEPSTMAIMRTLKILSPAQTTPLKIALEARDFNVPSEKWLLSKLDYLRKRKFIVRNSDGSYALSGNGIAIVPTSSSKSSSDIERILSLARRKVW